MSERSVSAATECSCDADILAEVSVWLQDSACLHYALTELIGDARDKAAAAQSSALRSALSGHLRAHSAKLGALANIRDAARIAISHRDQALKALARADHANAVLHIELCDADTLRRIEQRCSAGLSAETEGLLRLVHRILRQTPFSRSMPKGPVQR